MVSGPGSVPDGNDIEPGEISPAAKGSDRVTTEEDPTTGPLHPFEDTPMVAFPLKLRFQVTVAVGPVPLIVPAPSAPAGDNVQL